MARSPTRPKKVAPVDVSPDEAEVRSLLIKCGWLECGWKYGWWTHPSLSSPDPWPQYDAYRYQVEVRGAGN